MKVSDDIRVTCNVWRQLWENPRAAASEITSSSSVSREQKEAEGPSSSSSSVKWNPLAVILVADAEYNHWKAGLQSVSSITHSGAESLLPQTSMSPGWFYHVFRPWVLARCGLEPQSPREGGEGSDGIQLPLPHPISLENKRGGFNMPLAMRSIRAWRASKEDSADSNLGGGKEEDPCDARKRQKLAEAPSGSPALSPGGILLLSFSEFLQVISTNMAEEAAAVVRQLACADVVLCSGPVLQQVKQQGGKSFASVILKVFGPRPHYCLFNRKCQEEGVGLLPLIIADAIGENDPPIKGSASYMEKLMEEWFAQCPTSRAISEVMLLPSSMKRLLTVMCTAVCR